MLESEYNSAVRQSGVKNYLSSLRVTSFASQGTEMSDALAKVYKSIINFQGRLPDLIKVTPIRWSSCGTTLLGHLGRVSHWIKLPRIN